jgi:hypothetical protein
MTSTLVTRDGQVEVSPMPAASTEISAAGADAMHVLIRTVPTNPGAARTISRGEGWLEAHDSIRKIAAICTAKSLRTRERSFTNVAPSRNKMHHNRRATIYS